ncbi:MAG: diaminopimelate decarboxylase [Acidimicrobiia bacterium]
MEFPENIFPIATSVNDNGAISIDGISIADIVRTHSTPLMVYSAQDVIKATKSFVEVFDRVFYASKAAPIIGLEQIIFENGAGCDVSSAGELQVALKAGCKNNKIIFHGNNKSENDIRHALENNVLRIVVDSIDEIELIEQISEELKINNVNVQARITVGIEAHTHEAIMTGGNDGKFGNPIITGDAKRICQRIIESNVLNLCGLHCHIGSQIFETKHLAEAARIMSNFFVEIKDEFNIDTISELNVGGGFGIKYEANDDPPAPIEMAKAVRAAADEILKSNGLNNIEIWSEPGRALVGQAGISVYTIGTIKEIEGLQTYVSVDGGMSDNARPATYGAVHGCWVDNRGINLEKDELIHVSVAGKHCEQGDILNKDAQIPKSTRIGDLLIMTSTGAYCFSMSSNYNMLTRPEVVLVDGSNDEKVKVIVRRETIDDILKRQVL